LRDLFFKYRLTKVARVSHNAIMNVQLMRSSVDPPSVDIDQHKMIIAFFDAHPSGDYLFKDIKRWLLDKYNFVLLRTRYGNGKRFLERLGSSISSLLNQFYTMECFKPKRNFERIMTGKSYIYRALPKTSNLVLPKPVQKSFDYDAVEDTQPEDTRTVDTTIQKTVIAETVNEKSEPTLAKDLHTDETTTSVQNSQLFEDVQASDKINDPLQRIIDSYTNIDLYDIDEFQITAIKSGKKITISISNA